MQRLIIEIRERASNQLWKRLASLPTQEQKKALEELLVVPQDQRISQFDRFRKGPINISGPSFVEAVWRYSDLRAYGLQDLGLIGAIERHGYSDNIRVLPLILKTYYHYVAFAPETPEDVIKQVDLAVQKLKASGELAKIRAKYEYSAF